MFLSHVSRFRSSLRRHDHIAKFSEGALEGVSDRMPREIGLHVSVSVSNQLSRINYFSQKHGRQPPRAIFTLDPNKFAEKKQQRFRIGYQRTTKVYVSLRNQWSGVNLDYNHCYDCSKGTQTWKRHPFPSDTNAFLYYFIPPEKPRIAGELRLRVTSSDDPASFKSGSDVLLPNGRPWSRPLSILPKKISPLYEKLREEGFVPDDLDRVLLTLPTIIQSLRYNSNRQRLYTLNDTFIVDFTNIRSFLFITERAVEMKTHFGIFDRREKFAGAPFTGAHFKSPSFADLILIIHRKCLG